MSNKITRKHCKSLLYTINSYFEESDNIEIKETGINPMWKSLYRRGEMVGNPVRTYADLHNSLKMYQKGLLDAKLALINSLKQFMN
jgi:hypothetical protein